MTGLPAKLEEDEEVTALKLAREIAMDFHDIDKILETHGVTGERYEALKSNPYFRALLASEMAAWSAAANTNERVKVKAAGMLEEWLPEAYARAHDPKETLSSKVELMKLIKSLTSVGLNASEGNGGERLSVTINLGGDAKLTYEKTVTPQVIEGEVLSK